MSEQEKYQKAIVALQWISGAPGEDDSAAAESAREALRTLGEYEYCKAGITIEFEP